MNKIIEYEIVELGGIKYGRTEAVDFTNDFVGDSETEKMNNEEKEI